LIQLSNLTRSCLYALGGDQHLIEKVPTLRGEFSKGAGVFLTEKGQLVGRAVTIRAPKVVGISEGLTFPIKDQVS